MNKNFLKREKAAAVIITALVLALILGIAGCELQSDDSNELTIYPGDPIVCFGDSLTEGVGAGLIPGLPEKTRSYPAYLQQKIKVKVVNAGVSGETSEDALDRLDDDVISKSPQAVIVLLGANDLFGKRAAADTKTDIQTIITSLKAEGCKIFLASFIGDEDWEESVLEAVANPPSYLASQYPPGYADALVALFPDYKQMFVELQAIDGIEFIPDIWTGVWGSHMSDPIHPDSAGYKIMADNIFNKIKPYLLENNLVR